MRYASAGLSIVLASVVLGPAAADGPGTCVVRVAVRDGRDVMLMGQLSGDCWSHGPDGAGRMDWRVARDALPALAEAGLAYEVVIADCEADAEAEAARLAGPFEGREWFDDFRPYAEVSAFADTIVAGHPDLVRRQAIGLSIEQRELFCLRLTSPANGGFDGGKPVILMNATQHAREWITVMAAMYTVNRLANEWAPGAADADLLDKYEVILVPVVNVDGYVFTWANPNNRYWRTNRRPNANGTFGVDTNRNWGYEWGRSNGSSGQPGSETYRGTAPFSEPETAAMRDLVLGLGSRVVMHLDVHSYGLYILWPWGYTPSPTPASGLFTVWGDRMRDAMGVSGQTYRPGQSYTRLYPTSGDSKDWMYGAREALTWTIEMTTGGFSVPPSNIRPSGEELYACVKTIARNWCPADFNRDAFVDFFDYDAYLAGFQSGALRADFNLDGFLDFFDYADFVVAFEAGC